MLGIQLIQVDVGKDGADNAPLGRSAVGILLLHAEAAPFHLIHGGDRHRMSILPHSDRFPGPGRQHGFISYRLENVAGGVAFTVGFEKCLLPPQRETKTK